MQSLNNIITNLGYSSIEDAAKKHAYMIVMSKISKYESEYNHFKKKYDCEYPVMEKEISKVDQSENFEIEDDLLNWRFAYEQLINYKDQISKLTA
jgi:hypothetical protein